MNMSNIRENTISVVIPTANRHNTIARAVEEIYKNTIAPHEVIVVDQSEDDLTFKALQTFIEEKELTYIKDDGKGISRGRNVGWRIASGEIIAFTDDDAWVDSKWLENVLSTFQHNSFNIGAIGGKIIPVYEERNPNWSFPEKWEYLLPACNHGDAIIPFAENLFPIGVNFFTLRYLLLKFNGFDENMGFTTGKSLQVSGEDVDYHIRLRKNGFDLIYNPNCVVYHPVPLTRQNQEFLNKRLMYEGATYAYRELKERENVFLWILASLLKSCIKYFIVVLTKGNKEDAHYLYGKIVVLIKFGLFHIQP
jgi:glucosyl-dolichyl phosphate glucuronosyltransferase